MPDRHNRVDSSLGRRAVLATAGSALAAGVAGCLGTPDGDDVETLGDGPENETNTTDPGSSVEIEGDAQFTELYDQVVGAVTMIAVRSGQQSGQGSGFLVDDHLVTNHHVVQNAQEADLRYANDDWGTATVVGSDVYSDLAVLEPAESPPAETTTLSFAEEQPVVGQEVMAIGNPFGLEGSASTGIVSGVDRSLPSQTGYSVPNTVQTDAAVNPGNSGGPLVDLDGNVLGVIHAGGGTLGFAISAALARRVVPSLIEDGDFGHSYLGVRLQEVTPAVVEVYGLDEVRGIVVAEVLPGGPADGVLQGGDEQRVVDGRPVVVGGDVIVAIDGTVLPDEDALATHLALETDPGETVSVTVIRDGEELTGELTLGERPDPQGTG